MEETRPWCGRRRRQRPRRRRRKRRRLSRRWSSRCSRRTHRRPAAGSHRQRRCPRRRRRRRRRRRQHVRGLARGSALDSVLSRTARSAPATKATKPVSAARIRAQKLRQELLQTRLARQHLMSPTQRLLLAADMGDADMLERILDDSGLDANTADDHGRTALHFAACAGHPDIVRVLIARGCDLNVRDVNQNTPLHLAVISTHIPVVTALLRAGADINVDNVCKSTPIAAAKAKLRMMRMHNPDNDPEGADELLEVLDLLLVYAEHTHARHPGALDLSELRARLEGIPTMQDKFDAIELALDQLALL